MGRGELRCATVNSRGSIVPSMMPRHRLSFPCADTSPLSSNKELPHPWPILQLAQLHSHLHLTDRTMTAHQSFRHSPKHNTQYMWPLQWRRCLQDHLRHQPAMLSRWDPKHQLVEPLLDSNEPNPIFRPINGDLIDQKPPLAGMRTMTWSDICIDKGIITPLPDGSPPLWRQHVRHMLHDYEHYLGEGGLMRTP